MEIKNLRNFWINRSKEKNILKVVEWAHKKNRSPLCLKIDEVIDALKAYIRDSLHS
jgi:hypothetical protein